MVRRGGGGVEKKSGAAFVCADNIYINDVIYTRPACGEYLCMIYISCRSM